LAVAAEPAIKRSDQPMSEADMTAEIRLEKSKEAIIF
jgi:hypothetical protein